MKNIVLMAPEIPQNTGSIGRLCVNLNFRLHLIEPLGFSLEEKMLRRAGLDYWPHLDVSIHKSWDEEDSMRQINMVKELYDWSKIARQIEAEFEKVIS